MRRETLSSRSTPTSVADGQCRRPRQPALSRADPIPRPELIMKKHSAASFLKN